MPKYTTEQIILGTREELKKLQVNFKKLKELTSLKQDKNVKDIRYYLINDTRYSSSNKQPFVGYTLSWNNHGLRGFVNEIHRLLQTNHNDAENGKVIIDNDGQCSIKNKKYNIFIPDKNQEEF